MNGTPRLGCQDGEKCEDSDIKEHARARLISSGTTTATTTAPSVQLDATASSSKKQAAEHDDVITKAGKHVSSNRSDTGSWDRSARAPMLQPTSTPLKLTIKLGPPGTADIRAVADHSSQATAVLLHPGPFPLPGSNPRPASLGDKPHGSAAGGRKKGGTPSLPSATTTDPPLVESLGIDVPSRRDLLARNQLGHNPDALRIGATVSVQQNTEGATAAAETSKVCGVCGLRFEHRPDFAAHILSHRNGGGGGSGGENDDGIHQCEDCGACFASAPSWSRHRLLVHRIREFVHWTETLGVEDEEEKTEEWEEHMSEDEEHMAEGEDQMEDGEEQIEEGEEMDHGEDSDSDSERRLVIDTGEDTVETEALPTTAIGSAYTAPAPTVSSS